MQSKEDFTNEILSKLDELDYSSIRQPAPPLGMFQSLISTCRSEKAKTNYADIMVDSKNGKRVIIEVRPQYVLRGSIMYAFEIVQRYGLPVIVCYRDRAYDNMPSSISEFAEMNNIKLTSLSNLEETLTKVLKT